MDFKLRNIDRTLSKNVLEKAQELSKDNKINGNDVNILLETAAKDDGIVSEEEVRFIAGVTEKNNLSNLIKSNFNPINKEINFKNLSDARLDVIRNKRDVYEKGTSNIEKALRNDQDIRVFMNALNNTKLTLENRKELIENYKNKQITGLGTLFNQGIIKKQVFTAGSSGYLSNVLGDYLLGNLNPINKADENYKTNINDSNKTEQEKTKQEHLNRMSKSGIYPVLFKLNSEKPRLDILNNLTKDISKGLNVSPKDLFNKAVKYAKDLKSDNPNRDALICIAGIVNSIHKGRFSGSSLENKILTQSQESYKILNEDKKDVGDSVVMSHNAPKHKNEKKDPGVDYNSDNNLHFWTQAFISYEMMNNGYDKQKAKSFSAYLGAEFELINIGEHKGNSGIKDIIINTYGAEFGVQLFEKANVVLPNKNEGPMVENKRDF